MEAALTHDLLRDFSNLPEGARYAADGEKLKLLSLYILLRSLTPSLTFELFLEKYQPIADFTADNRKHPDDAVYYHCPRSAKQAAAQNMPQWSAKEVVDILVLYTDMCRVADAAGEPVPMTLDEYLAMDGPAFKRGEIEAPARTKRGPGPGPRSRAAVESTTPTPVSEATGVNLGQDIRPRQPGQRAIYSHPTQNGRQVLGTVVSLTVPDDKGRQYVTFQTDDGQLWEDCAIAQFAVTDAAGVPTTAQAAPSAVPAGHEVPTDPPADVGAATAIHKTLRVSATEAHDVKQKLGMGQPVGNVDIGGVLQSWAVDCDNGFGIDLQLMNGETGPYIDSQLVDLDQDCVVGDLPPRESLLGLYNFSHAAVTYTLEVKTRGGE